MKFLNDILAKAGLVVDGIVTLNNTSTGQTPATGDSSTNLATTAFVKNQGYLTPITGVPYIGATGAVNLGPYDLTVNSIKVGMGSGAGSNSTVVGSYALGSNTIGVNNTAVGYSSMQANTEGYANTAIGGNSLTYNTTGHSNTANGVSSMYSNITGANNTAIGTISLRENENGVNNTAIGYRSLTGNTSNNNTAIGADAGFGIGLNPNTTGSNNIFIGYQSVGQSSTESNRTWIGNINTDSTWLAGKVLIGGNTNNNYQLEVTGSTKVSGILTLGSTITNGIHTYTLPSATGTIALVGGAGVGTVTSVAALTIGTSGTDVSSTVANSTTTPVITLNVPTASASNRGVLSSGDWTTFNGKQAALNGTGFVKATGTTISYDNSTYALDSVVVKLTGSQSIAGVKTFTDRISVGATSSLSSYNANFGTLHLQSYLVNNAWFGDNVYYNGSNFIRVATGFTGAFYFQGPEGQFRFGASGAAGTSVGNGTVTLKTNLDGSFAVGNLSTATSNYTGYTFYIAGSTGAATLTNLAGTGTRMVVANSTGLLSTQSIPTGTVTSVATAGTVSGLTLTGGTITTSGTITLGGTLSLTSGNVTTALGFTPYNETNPSGYITGITSGNVTTALGFTPYNSTNPSGYITSTGTATSLSGGGGSSIQRTAAGTSYSTMYQIREASGYSGNTAIAGAPALGFLWGGVVASSILMESSGRISIRDNPGTSYEAFIASTIYASNSFQGNLTGNVTGNISGNAATATTATNFNNGSAYSSAGSVYVDTLESINTNDWLELTYYGGLGVRIGTGVNGSKALYAGSLYDAGNRVYSAGNPQVNISGNAATVTINYNNDSASTYQMLWGSGNSVYGTAGVYINPNIDTIYAAAYRGSANVGGTGEATWHPAGIYSGSTQWLYGTTYRNNATTSGQGWMYFDGNYGYGMIGLYNPNIFQGIFAMGDAYKLTAGGGMNNLYGLTWSHPNAGGQATYLNDHGLIVAVNGLAYSAISSNIWARGNIIANGQFNGPGTGLTGTAAGLSIGGSAGSAPNGGNINNYYDSTAGNGYGFRFWNGSEAYKISMGASALYYYGPVTDYSLKMQMDNGSTGRGFTWGRESYAPIAALNSTSGNMQIAGTLTAGSGGPSNYGVLNLYGSDYGGGYWGRAECRNSDGNFWLSTRTNSASWFDNIKMNSSGVTVYGSFVNSSDIIFKTNVETIPNALSKVLEMRGVTFNRIERPEDPKEFGFIAQELLPIIPEVVHKEYKEIGNTEDFTYSVSYITICALLTEAIKEQQQQIEQLKQLIK